ncbi:unnamed protein product [Mesocestoides corti]|uniref:Leucine carboxyl methyltransferase 1 n=1 Tax=Mesocestoides corti TaxID=53468 RepID=A0A0R3U648_MESCO|nr:unnamed protein product [Mesocestoides corti]
MDFAPCDRVQHTNDEATATKAHAVRRGYWKDPYIVHFCPFPSVSTPEISRGYYIRVQTFEAMVLRFIQENNRMCQVINLGAGSDTLFFRLKEKNLVPAAYVEIDLPANMKKKVFTLQRNKTLWTALSCECVSFGCYHLLSWNLQESPASLITLLCDSPEGPRLSLELPTFFIAECVLVYISNESSNSLLSALATEFARAAFLNYEQVCYCIHYRSVSKFWIFLDTCNGVTSFLFLTSTYRIRRLEMLDDTEITKQLYDHYCIVLATNSEDVCRWTELKMALSEVK